MNRSLSTGRFTAALSDIVQDPHWRVTRPLAVYCHGGTADATQAAGIGLAAVPGILAPITRMLHPVVAPSLGSAHWGNATARTRIGDAITWGTANRNVAGPVVLVGTSMGVTAALNYAADNPGAVACVVGIIPAIDLQAIRVADTNGARAGIDTAYGVVYPAALPTGSNPAARTAELDIPIQLWTASDDAVSANAPAFATATGAVVNDVGALGHDNDAVAAVDPNIVAAFIAASL